MGDNSSFYEPGQEQSLNGNDYVHSPDNWRDSVVNSRPKKFKPAKFVVLLSFDLFSLCYLAGIIGGLNESKEVIGVVVAILYLVIRSIIVITKLAMMIVKFLTFVGKNKSYIKQGFREIKDIFNE
jgi:hypothetical protein